MEIENSLQLGETPDEATNAPRGGPQRRRRRRHLGGQPVLDRAPRQRHGRDHQRASSTSRQASTAWATSAPSAPLRTPARRSTTLASPLGQVFTGRRRWRPVPVRRQPLQVQGLGRPNPGDADINDGQGAVERLSQAAGRCAARLGGRAADGDRCQVGRPRRRFQLLRHGGPAADPLRRRASPTWSRSSATASTPTRSPGCPVRWTTSSSTTRLLSGRPAPTSGTSTVASRWRWSTAGTTTTAPTSTRRSLPVLRPRPGHPGPAQDRPGRAAPGPVDTTVTGTAAPIHYGTAGSVSVKVGSGDGHRQRCGSPRS